MWDKGVVYLRANKGWDNRFRGGLVLLPQEYDSQVVQPQVRGGC